MTRFRISTRKIVFIPIMIVAGIFIFGSIVMYLWNALMPVIFHLPVIGFWQALGLLLLSKILFGGFRGGRGGGPWKRNMREKWMHMTPEEKEKFKQSWRSRCGGHRFEDFGNPFEGNPFEEKGSPFGKSSTRPDEQAPSAEDKNK